MTMKKILVVCLICLFFVNCGEDDQGVALIGVWIGDFQDVTLCDSDPEAVRSTALRCNDATCYRLTLEADGTYSYQQGTLVENGTYEGNFTRLTLCMDEEGETTCMTYAVEGNTSATLDISTTNEATGCKTTLFFNRELPDDSAS